MTTFVWGVRKIEVCAWIRKTQNINEALNDQNEAWQRVALMLGWSKWQLNVKSDKVCYVWHQ